MTKTIISAVVSVICTAAICITAFLCVNNYKKETAAVSNDYMTEAQAAEYLGISENHLTIMRKNLKYLEGSYIVYSYVDDNDKDVSVCMYSKDELDKAVEKLYGEQLFFNDDGRLKVLIKLFNKQRTGSP